MTTHVGIDVGGTFTDLWAIADGQLVTMKVPSRPSDPSRAVSDAFQAAGIDPAALTMFSHGTTIATNAFIQRNGARIGLLATKGFRDLVEMGRRERPQTYGMYGEARPLAPRDRRYEVAGRLNHLGEVLEGLDETAVLDAGRKLKEQEVACVVVAFLHSYANPIHEQRARELLLDVESEWTVVLSSDVMREFQEFERASTACIQAYLSPLVQNYARRLTADLREAEYQGEISIMQSNGGVVGIDKVHEQAARLIRSGPAAGIVGSIEVAGAAGITNFVTADMGGTSFDVAVVSAGRLRATEETELAFRIPLRLPTVDVASIGAGGGSIAWVDGTGLLQVGPRSAGADPGPVAYGGAEPTVTDANLVLGRIGVESRIGEGRRLDLAGARDAMRRLGAELGLDVEEAAVGVLQVVNHNMANLVRQLTIERGWDPRDFACVPFGGAGPLHAVAISSLLGMRTVLVPRYPGVLSGMGSLLADVRYDAVRTVDAPLTDAIAADVRRICNEQALDGARELESDGAEVVASRQQHQADLCYEGQLHTLTVGFDPDVEDVVTQLGSAFTAQYVAEFGTTLDRAIRVVNVRTSTFGQRPEVPWRAAIEKAERGLPDGRRDVYLDGAWTSVPLHDRAALAAGAEIDGPCVLEQTDCTTFLEVGTSGRVDEHLNLILEVG
jgi:N-methylhydantoinase A